MNLQTTQNIQSSAAIGDSPAITTEAVAANRWAYPATEAKGRDLRVDFLRGVAMATVVIAHIEIPSLYRLLTPERFGVVSEPEIFIFLSGLVIGLIYPARIIKEGWSAVARKLLRRSLQLYIVSLCVVIGVYLLNFVPLLNPGVLNSFTNRDTGVTYSLYNNAGGDFLNFIKNTLVLRYGPGQFNIMGLFVVLMIAAPFILWMLTRRYWFMLLLISGGIYLYNQLQPTRVTVAQFENAFSLLSWQFLFVVGVMTGFYREQVKILFQGKYAKWLIGAAIGIFCILMIYSLNNPWMPLPYNVRLSLLSEETFNSIYNLFFSRLWLGIGRVFNALLVIGIFYTLLTAFWSLFDRTLSWFFIPLGQASLYVFIVHLFFVMLMANIPLFQQGRPWINTLGETLVLFAIWLMIRKRFLFRIIPR
jgi:hypothetical protein